MTANELQELFKAKRDDDIFCPTLRIRIHRAISWVKSAEQYEGDADIAFCSYWIAFNACYAQEEISHSESERDQLKCFLDKIIQHDTEQSIYQCLWYRYSDYIRGLVNNHYLFPLFWKNLQNPHIHWERHFNNSKKRAFQSLANNQTLSLLCIVFDRLYMMRNQIVHGGATYQSSLNRKQTNDSTAFMKDIMPVIIQIMINNPSTNWGDVFYPPVDI